jgi:hypothetical protein
MISLHIDAIPALPLTLAAYERMRGRARARLSRRAQDLANVEPEPYRQLTDEMLARLTRSDLADAGVTVGDQ